MEESKTNKRPNDGQNNASKRQHLNIISSLLNNQVLDGLVTLYPDLISTIRSLCRYTRYSVDLFQCHLNQNINILNGSIGNFLNSEQYGFPISRELINLCIEHRNQLVFRWACKMKQYDVIVSLLSIKKIDPHKYNDIALQWVLNNKDTTMMILLLQRVNHSLITNSLYNEIFTWACSEHISDIIKLMFQDSRIDVNENATDFTTTIFIKGAYSIFADVIETNYEFALSNFIDDNNMILAHENNYIDLVRGLIEFKELHGKAKICLLLTCHQDNIPMLDCLLDYLTLSVAEMQSCLDIACSYSKHETVLRLLERFYVFNNLSYIKCIELALTCKERRIILLTIDKELNDVELSLCLDFSCNECDVEIFNILMSKNVKPTSCHLCIVCNNPKPNYELIYKLMEFINPNVDQHIVFRTACNGTASNHNNIELIKNLLEDSRNRKDSRENFNEMFDMFLELYSSEPSEKNAIIMLLFLNDIRANVSIAQNIIIKVACMFGYMDVLNLCLHRGILPDFDDNVCITNALEHGELEIVRKLLEYESVSISIDTIQNICQLGNYEIISLLAAYKRVERMPLLYWIFENGSTEQAIDLFQELYEDLFYEEVTRQERFEYFVTIAIRRDFDDIVELLLNLNDINPSFQDNLILLLVCRKGKMKIFLKLLLFQTISDSIDIDRIYACGTIDIIEYIIETTQEATL